MEEVSTLDIINTAIPAIAILGGLIYAIIRLHVDVEHIKKQITSLFDLWNSRDK